MMLAQRSEVPVIPSVVSLLFALVSPKPPPLRVPSVLRQAWAVVGSLWDVCVGASSHYRADVLVGGCVRNAQMMT